MAKRRRQAGATKSKRRKAGKAPAKRPVKRAVSKKAKKPAKKAKKPAKKAGKRQVTKTGRGGATGKTSARKKKPSPAPAPQIEAEIIDVVEEPFPGVVTLTEFETVRVTVPDSDDDNED
jgi:hypothetical protein